MENNIEKLDPELKKVLRACNMYWYSMNNNIDKTICYSWVVKIYIKRFNESFHQSALIKLSKLGYLKKVDTSRSGGRIYYKIVKPENPSSYNI